MTHDERGEKQKENLRREIAERNRARQQEWIHYCSSCGARAVQALTGGATAPHLHLYGCDHGATRNDAKCGA